MPDTETQATPPRRLTRYARGHPGRIVAAAIHSIAGGRTPAVIAHQLSTITHGGRVHVLDGSRLAEAGHHGAIYEMVCAVQTGEATNPEVKG